MEIKWKLMAWLKFSNEFYTRFTKIYIRRVKTNMKSRGIILYVAIGLNDNGHWEYGFGIMPENYSRSFIQFDGQIDFPKLEENGLKPTLFQCQARADAILIDFIDEFIYRLNCIRNDLIHLNYVKNGE